MNKSSPSNRQLRVGELVKHSLAEVFFQQDFNDPDLYGILLSVNQVVMSPDLKNAIVYVMTIGKEEDAAIIKALNRHHKFFRGVIARKVNLKYNPKITFKFDNSFSYSQKIENLLNDPKVRQDIAKNGGEE